MKYQIAGTNVIRYKVLCSMCILIHTGIQNYTKISVYVDTYNTMIFVNIIFNILFLICM